MCEGFSSRIRALKPAKMSSLRFTTGELFPCHLGPQPRSHPRSQGARSACSNPFVQAPLVDGAESPLGSSVALTNCAFPCSVDVLLKAEVAAPWCGPVLLLWWHDHTQHVGRLEALADEGTHVAIQGLHIVSRGKAKTAELIARFPASCNRPARVGAGTCLATPPVPSSLGPALACPDAGLLEGGGAKPPLVCRNIHYRPEALGALSPNWQWSRGKVSVVFCPGPRPAHQVDHEDQVHTRIVHCFDLNPRVVDGWRQVKRLMRLRFSLPMVSTV